jgi:hypothetical protein
VRGADALRETAFLLHADSGAVLLGSTAHPATHVLIPKANLALYDPAFELLWYLAGAQLEVLDLRAPNAPSVVVVRGMPDVSRLVVRRAGSSVSTNDGCDVPTGVFTWSDAPSVETFSEDEPGEPRIENREWLRAQLERSVRSLSEPRAFGFSQLALPAERLDCEMPEDCGTTAEFGIHDWQLVLVRDTSGGDCWNRGCLLRSPGDDRYATPPQASKWGSAKEQRLGPCGLYLFDEQRTAFLVNRWLCRVDGNCQKLKGTALGWLVPGDTVGAVGDVGSSTTC